MKKHRSCRGLDVPNSLLRPTILKMSIDSTVRDSFPHGFAVLDPPVICESSVIAMVVFDVYPVRCCVALETPLAYTVDLEVQSSM